MSEQRAYFKLDSLDLNSVGGNYVVTGFQDITGRKRVAWAAGDVTVSGSDRGDVAYPNKKFSMGLNIRVQDDTSTLDAALRTLYEKLVEVDDSSNTVWLYHRPVADTSWATIRKIRVLHVECSVPTDQRAWKARVLDGITLEFECEEAWRANSETELISATTIETADDGTGDNYVDIGTPGIDGDVPALCRISVTSTDGNYTSWKIGVGQAHCLEWEDVSDDTSNNDDNSAGSCGNFTPSSAWSSAGSMTISGTSYGVYKVFARVKDTASTGGNAYIRMHWGIASTANYPPWTDTEVIEGSAQIKPTRYSGSVPSQIWVDVPLGTVNFSSSAWSINSNAPTYFSIKLDIKRTSGTDTIRIDRVYLMPIDYGFSWVGRSSGYAGSVNGVVHLSSIEDKAYIASSGSVIVGTPSVDGGIIRLDPVDAGSTRYIYFLWDEDPDPSEDGESTPPRSMIYDAGSYKTASVTVNIVPRYL